MPDVIEIPDRGYRFAPYAFQYSSGLAALPGWRIERVRFTRPVPLDQGFRLISEMLRGEGVPLTAFCACELRSPAPFTDQGFLDFNKRYAAVLGEWGVPVNGQNPVTRSNVCPDIAPPPEPSFYAFSYVRPASGAPPSFTVSGSGESVDGAGSYAERTVAYRDVSPDGMRKKAEQVMRVIEARMAGIGFSWREVTGTQVYTVYDITPFLPDLFVARGAAAHGVTWHHARPPVVDLEFEVDARGVGIERVV
jgi:hypothetical protein